MRQKNKRQGEKHSWRRDFQILGRGIRFVGRLEPRMIPIGIIKALCPALSPFVSIIMTSQILNTLLTTRDVQTLAAQVLITIGLNWFFSSLADWSVNYRNVLILSMARKQWMQLSTKMMEMDYQTAENPQTHLLYQQIRDRCLYMGRDLWGVVEKIESLIQGLISVVVSIGITAALFISVPTAENASPFTRVMASPYLSAALLALVVLSVVASVMFSLRQNKAVIKMSADKEFSRGNRIFDYYINHLQDYKTGKDVRLYHQRTLIREEFNRSYNGVSKKLIALCRCNGRFESLRSAVSVTVSGLVYLFVGCKALAGLLSVGNIVQYTGGVTQFISGFSMLMTQLADLKMMSKDFEFYFDYLDRKNVLPHGDRCIKSTADGRHELEFRDVSFRYPGSENWVLRHVNLKLAADERLAVVGVNGSGKTTMIKLLCRLYDPVEGQILLDGVDIREYDYEAYQNLFSVVFQDFKLFALEVAQNIAADVDYDPARVEEALRQAGLWERVQAMEKGIETPVYKEYYADGVEISGGEAQKLAIARALYHQAAFVILDEPTAALDPISEFEIYSRFDSMVGERTAVYISHRLSSCRFCRRIVVFDNGEVIQSGSHEELLQDEGGKYYQLWTAQAQYYDEESQGEPDGLGMAAASEPS